MAIMCIDAYSDGVVEFFRKKAKKNKKGFVIFDNCGIDEFVTDSYVILKHVIVTKKLVRFLGKSRPRGNTIIYFEGLIKYDYIKALTDFYGVLSLSGKKLDIFKNSYIGLNREGKILKTVRLGG